MPAALTSEPRAVGHTITLQRRAAQDETPESSGTQQPLLTRGKYSSRALIARPSRPKAEEKAAGSEESWQRITLAAHDGRRHSGAVATVVSDVLTEWQVTAAREMDANLRSDSLRLMTHID